MTALQTHPTPRERSIRATPPPAPEMAYLCGQYPAISHTFVLREVLALRGIGARIATFSIRRAGAEHLLADADRVAFDTTYAILPPRPGKLLAAHLGLLFKAPRAYLSTLAFALKLAPTGLRGRIWQFFYFLESVVLHGECRRLGLRHIHAHLANVAADVALLTAHLGSALDRARPWTWSFTMHGPTEFFDVGHFRLAQKVEHAHFVVCISDFARSQLMALSQPSCWGKLHVVHVGIPIEQFTRSAGEEHPRNEHLILSIGRLVPDKGHAVLLEAIALLADRGCRLRVTLAGDGPSRAGLERLAQSLGIDQQVSFTGAVGQDDIHELYARASVFCMSSFAEGVPCVLMEAMAMELPVVSTRIAGIPELIDDGDTGLLVAPGRPDLLADAVRRLFDDPRLARELGLAARAKVIREFNAHTTAEQLHEVFARELPRSSL
jgi:colanic acid/amylovoran biosynthesis glycosyltransferase